MQQCLVMGQQLTSSMAFMSPEGHMSASCSRAGSRHSSAAPGNHITCHPHMQ